MQLPIMAQIAMHVLYTISLKKTIGFLKKY